MDKSNTSGGIGFVGLLQVLFIGLKLTDNVQWSWLWVLSPMWVIPAIIISILVIVAIVVITKELLKIATRNKQK